MHKAHQGLPYFSTLKLLCIKDKSDCIFVGLLEHGQHSQLVISRRVRTSFPHSPHSLNLQKGIIGFQTTRPNYQAMICLTILRPSFVEENRLNLGIAFYAENRQETRPFAGKNPVSSCDFALPVVVIYPIMSWGFS